MSLVTGGNGADDTTASAQDSRTDRHKRRSRDRSARASRYPRRVTDWDLKPRTVGELLDASFCVYRRQFARLLLIAVIVSAPALVVSTVFADDAAAAARDWWSIITQSSRSNHGDFGRAFEDSLRAAGELQPFILLSSLLQSMGRAAGVVTMAAVAAAALRRERAAPIGTILRQAAPRLPAAVLAQMMLDYVLGICMTCPPVGFVLTILFSCTAVAIALEKGPMETSARQGLPAALRWAVLPFATAFDGLARSVRLNANGPSLGRGTLFLFFLLTFVGIANLSAIALATVFVSASGGWFWAQHYAEALFLPAWGLGVTFWYTDLRVRREGLDLEVAT